MSYTNGLDKPSDYFETLTWSGNSTDDRAISGLDFAPNWVWIKCRNNGQNHNIFDTVRGATESLESNNSNAENTDSTSLKSFTSDGYTLGTGSTVNSSSPSTKTYVGWNWKAGTSFTNDASATGIGTIDSTGSVSNTAGFSIVSYTGTGSAGTVAHGLGSKPKVVIYKKRNGASEWTTWHDSFTSSANYIFLDLDNSIQTYAPVGVGSHTTSVISVGNVDGVNGSSNTYIAYCFAEKQGYSKFGSYTGNGNADGTFIYTGFKPAWLLVKSTATNDWILHDTKRNPHNVSNVTLFPNGTDADVTNTIYNQDILSNGFKARTTHARLNGSGVTYIYMAFAENPFTTSTGVPATAR